MQLARSLDPAARKRLLALWDEYEAAATPETRAVKALDKMETILQHSQGDNPPDFDYGFNLTYGRDYAQHDECCARCGPWSTGHGARDGDPARRFIIRLNRSGFDPVQRTCAAEAGPFRQDILNAATAGMAHAPAREMLLRHRAAGWTRDRMYAELASMAVAAPEHEDYLHDLMDFVSGYCSPDMRIFD